MSVKLSKIKLSKKTIRRIVLLASIILLFVASELPWEGTVRTVGILIPGITAITLMIKESCQEEGGKK